MKCPSNHAGSEGGKYDTGSSLVATEERGPMSRRIDRFDRLSVRDQGGKHKERDQAGVNHGCEQHIAS